MGLVSGSEAGQQAAVAAQPLPGVASLPAPAGAADAAGVAAAIREAVPSSLRATSFIGLEAWQWAGLGILFLAGVAVAWGLRRAFGGVLARWLAQGGHAASAQRIRVAVSPFAHCAAGVIWLSALPLVGLPDVARGAVAHVVRLYAIVAAAWLGMRLADLAGERLHEAWKRTPSRHDDLLAPLARTSLKVVAISLACIYGLRSLGIEVGPIVASLGLGGLAVAFAAKDTIENFFGSIAVIADRPFEVGDTIAVAGVEGQVKEVGFRSTRLRTSRGTLVTLPNATLVRAIVERLGDARHQVIGFTLRLDMATSPDSLVAVRDAIREAVLAHPRTVDEETDVRLAAITDGGVDLLVRVVLEAHSKSSEREEREAILLQVLSILRRQGVQLAAPRPGPSAAPAPSAATRDAGSAATRDAATTPMPHAGPPSSPPSDPHPMVP